MAFLKLLRTLDASKTSQSRTNRMTIIMTTLQAWKNQFFLQNLIRFIDQKILKYGFKQKSRDGHTHLHGYNNDMSLV